MIRNTLGAAFIAGSAFSIYNTDTVKPIVDEAFTSVAQSIDIPREISQNKEIFQLGGGVLGLMLGVSMIAGAARRRLKKQHSIHPDVDKVLNKKLSILSDLLAEKTNGHHAKVESELSNVETALNELFDKIQDFDERLAGELKIDLTSLNIAIKEMDAVEGASQRVLEILEKIENSANTHIKFSTDDSILERFITAQNDYAFAHRSLKKAASDAIQHSGAKTSSYPERFNDMLGAAAQLDIKVQNSNGDLDSIVEAARNLTQTVSNHIDHISAKIINSGSNPGRSAPHFAAVSTAAANIIMTATELVSAQKALIENQKQNTPKVIQEQDLPQLDTQVQAANDTLTANEDGMIEVPGYGAIPANAPNPYNDFS